jgi:hypothetical protein
LRIEEDGQVGSYYSSIWIKAEENKKSLIKEAILYFEDEHDRDEECEECPSCLKERIESLKNEGEAGIFCSSGWETNFDIWETKII